MESKFKVGDKVRTLYAPVPEYKGKEGEVVEEGNYASPGVIVYSKDFPKSDVNSESKGERTAWFPDRWLRLVGEDTMELPNELEHEHHNCATCDDAGHCTQEIYHSYFKAHPSELHEFATKMAGKDSTLTTDMVELAMLKLHKGTSEGKILQDALVAVIADASRLGYVLGRQYQEVPEVYTK